MAGQEIDINASFFSFSTAVDADLIQSAYTDALDTCDVTVVNLTDVPDDVEIPDFSDEIGELTLLSAGDVITISSPAGSYAELSKTVFQSFIIYQSEDELTGPLPSGLVVDIPGDVFPALASVQVPDVEPISLTTPTIGQAVTSDTDFTWQAGNNQNAYVTLSSSQFSGDPASITTVDCTVTDDGGFSFPAATQTELGASFSGTRATISRSVSTFQQQGNAVLVVTRDSIDS